MTFFFVQYCFVGVFAVTSYKGMLVVCLFLGISKGIRTVYMTLVIPTYVPIERLASASGLQMVTNGLFLLILGPVVGKYQHFCDVIENKFVFNFRCN